MSNRALHFFTALLLFTFPLERFGVVVGGYPITLPFIAISMISLILLFQGRFRRRQLIPWVVFVIWITGSVFASGAYLSMLSVIVVTAMMIPSITVLPQGLERTAFRWLFAGSIFSLALAAYDAMATVFGAPSFQSISSLFLPQNVAEFMVFRLKSTFLEPSIYAIYLTFMIISLEIVPRSYLSATKRYVLMICYIAALLATLSLSGWVMLAAFYVARFAVKFSIILARKEPVRLKPILNVFIYVVALCGLAVLVGKALNLDIVDYLSVRVLRSAEITSAGTYEHEGARTNALRVISDYYSKVRFEDRLIGEGFNSSEKWLMRNYSLNDESRMFHGTVPNVYVAIFLGTGVVGFLLYLALLLSLFPIRLKHIFNADVQNLCCYYIVWIVAQFLTGSLALYYLWGYMLMLNIMANQIRNELTDDHGRAAVPDNAVAA